MAHATRPKVSIIIPCFNQAHYLAETVGSVIQQTWQDWECLIVNDGSQDNTRQVALSLASQEPRIQYIEQENRGLGGARNRGLEAAKGEYIQFLDSDDLIAPRKLELQLEKMPFGPELAISYCDYYLGQADAPWEEATGVLKLPVTLNPEEPLKEIALRWETSLSVPVHCFLLDARIFKDHGIHFDETLPNHEDWDCWMQVFAIVPTPMLVYIDQELAIYRHHGCSLSRNFASMKRGFLRAIRRQQAMFRDDVALLEMLRYKEKLVRREYIEWTLMKWTLPVARLILPRRIRRTLIRFKQWMAQ